MSSPMESCRPSTNRSYSSRTHSMVLSILFMVACLSFLSVSLWSVILSVDSPPDRCVDTHIRTFALHRVHVTRRTNLKIEHHNTINPNTKEYQLLRYLPIETSSEIDTIADKQLAPLLFVHGHRGSPNQVIHLAGEIENAVKQAQAKRNEQQVSEFAIYAVSFSFGAGADPAFGSAILESQSLWVNDALRTIQDYHGSHQRIQSIGLSFGGVVIRLAALAVNHPTAADSALVGHPISCLSTIYTLNTPHRAHPIEAEARGTLLYQELNHRWASEYSTSRSMLSHLALLSLSGGARDLVVRSDLGSLDGIAPPTHAIHIYTKSIDGISIDIDHNAIMRCGQVLTKLVSIVIGVDHRERASLAAGHALPLHMAYIERSLVSTTPTKLRMSTARPWRLSAIDEEESHATLALTPAEDAALQIDASHTLRLSTPTRNLTNLHRPIQIDLEPTISCRAENTKLPVHTYPAEESGIYLLDLKGESNSSPRVHTIRLPSTAPFDHLVVLANIPAMYICASLVSSDGSAASLNDWIVSAPSPTAFVSRAVRLQGTDLPIGGGTESSNTSPNIAHRWFGTPGIVRTNAPASIIIIHASDITKKMTSIELVFHLPPDSASCDVWSFVQFTPPIDFTTSVQHGVISPALVTARQTSFVRLPIIETRGPHASRIQFTIRAPSAQSSPKEALFQPILYSVALPSGEGSWDMGDPSSSSLGVIRTHLAPQFQTFHRIVFVDPRFAYELRVSDDWWSEAGQNIRAWYGVTMIGMVIATAAAIAGQVAEYARIQDTHRSEVEQIGKIPPVYSVLGVRPMHAILGAIGYSFSQSLYYSLSDVRNVGYLPSFGVTCVYLLIGWSLVILVSSLTIQLHALIVRTVGWVWQRIAPATFHTVRNKERTIPFIVKIGFSIPTIFLLVWYPLPLFVVCLFLFWLVLISTDLLALRRSLVGSQLHRPSLATPQPLCHTILFLFVACILLRASTIVHQIQAIQTWNLFELAWMDSIMVAPSIMLLVRLTQARTIHVTHSNDDGYKNTNAPQKVMFVNQAIIYVITVGIAIFAPWFADAHHYRVFAGAFWISIGLLAGDIHHASTGLFACFSSGSSAPVRSSSSSSVFDGIDDRIPTLDMLESEDRRSGGEQLEYMHDLMPLINTNERPYARTTTR